MANSYLTGLIKSIPLAFRLGISSFKFKKPDNFIGEFSFSLKRGCAGLLYFVERTNSFIKFSTTSEQQKEIIIYLVQTSKLIENIIDKGIISLEDFRKIILNKKGNEHPGIRSIKENLSNIRELAKNNSSYEKFLENLVKTWETHKVREIRNRNNIKISYNQALKSAEERGKFYFLSVIYSLNPSNFDTKSRNLIGIIGSWFQIIDDYSDRKKDREKKNTPFTISKEKPSIEFNQHIINYQKEAQVLLDSKHPLIEYMKNISVLWPLVSFILDWHSS